MVVWSRWGFLVILLLIPSFMIADIPFLVGYVVTGSIQTPGPLYVSVLCAVWGISCIVIGNRINDPQKDRVVVDAQTNQKFVIRKRSTLFWIPMQYWGYIIIAAGVISAIVSLLGYAGLLPVATTI
jgi:hypothetical protein